MLHFTTAFIFTSQTLRTLWRQRTAPKMSTNPPITSKLSATARQSALLTAEALKSHPPHTLLDASWHMPSSTQTGAADYEAAHIPGAVFFDIDKDGLCDATSSLPHMIPSPQQFSHTVAELGVHPERPIVIYASSNFVGAARAWWMFKLFGWSDVTVLDGGLAAWKADGGQLASGLAKSVQAMEPRKVEMNPGMLRTMSQMLEQIDTGAGYIIDARPQGRFNGTAPEPRAGLMGGHMPGAINVPATAVIGADGKMLKSQDLVRVFSNAGLDVNSTSVPVSLTCGSGVTAAILLLALHEIGIDGAVYDGSWSEYGGYHDNPLAVGKAPSAHE